MNKRNRIVVCDNGTGFVKCGFAGDNFPRAQFPCMVGTPVVRYGERANGQSVKDVVVGAECERKRHLLKVSYPVSNGAVTDWEAMGCIWEYTFQECLQVDPSECSILLTDPPLNPRRNRERMLETMFECFGFESAFIQLQAVLTMYAQGLLTGLVLDSGDGVSHAVPVIEGCTSPYLIKRLDVAGRHITTYLVDLLMRRGYSLSNTADFDTIRMVKEDLCYVADNYRRELKLAQETTCLVKAYTLPDGRVIKLGAERFMAPEALFSPAIMDTEAPGLPEMIFNCIQESEIDNRCALYQHIVLSGGSTMFPGMPSRLERELRQLYHTRVVMGNSARTKRLKLRVEDPPNRRNLVFLGAAVLADLMKGRKECWISRAEYEENPHQALQKCCSA